MPQPITVRFWGTRGSIPSPGAGTVRYGGNTSCVEVTVGGETLIFDAGTGARLLGTELLNRAAGKPMAARFFISHTHWDHIQGLPFFTPLYVPGHRFEIHGPPGIDPPIEQVIRAQMDRQYFPVELGDCAATLSFHEFSEPSITFGDITVRAHYVHHTALTLAYRVEAHGRSVVYATDHEIYTRMYRTRGEPESLVKLGERHDEEFGQFIAGADLYIGEAQYTAPEYPAKLGWGHSTVEDIAALAARAGVKQLALYHHDPARTDNEVDALAESAHVVVDGTGKRTQVFAAREGAAITL
jgi:phosphoribosyl 1,2-cyclic phosphodiesterase